jgi:hypothetical protein
MHSRNKQPLGLVDQDQSRDDDRHTRALAERAADAARAELSGDRLGILGALGESGPVALSRNRTVPDRWSFLHVMDRMEEGFRVLSRLPMSTRPRGYINSMPTYLYDRADLNAQLETDELDRLAKIRNSVRIRPSPAEIDRMEEALHWPSLYLNGREFHHLARAVNLASLWAAFDVDIDRAVKRIKVTRRTFNARQLQGFRIIAQELVRNRILVR